VSSGSVLRRGKGWVFIVDLGSQPKQRCTGCRFQRWVDGSVLGRCKSCDAAMGEPRLERRQKWSRQYPTKTEAQRAHRDAQGLIDKGRDPFPESLTGHELASRWLEHKNGPVRATTLRRYRTLLNRYILPAIGGLPVSQVRPAHIQRLLDEAVRRGLAARTVQQIRAVCSSMFSTAERWEIIDRNPVRGARTRQPERPDLEVPTAAQVAALVEAARGTVWAVPVLLAATLGARRSEVLAISWSVVDVDRGRVQIVRNLQRVPGEGLRFFDPKSSRSRRLIVPPPFVVAVLRAWRRDQAERRLLAGAAWQNLDLVCDRGDGGPLDPDAFSHAAKRLMAKAGLHPATRLHDCRHAFATTLLEQGVDTAIVSSVLGHATTWFTADTYQHVREGMAEQAAAAIEQAYRR
jgi:integrase